MKMNEAEFMRFMEKIDVGEFYKNDCWSWRSTMASGGYAYWFFRGKQQKVSRIVYEHWKGRIPHGLVVDHICNNPPCVNPDHLQAVTQKQNVLRGNGPTAINARKTHCKRGHKFTKKTIYTYGNKDGKECVVCKESYYRRNVPIKHKPFSSKYRGVSWNKKRKIWQAQLTFHGSIYWLGYFDVEKDAGHAVIRKLKELYGHIPKTHWQRTNP
jgi:hypothetical protein